MPSSISWMKRSIDLRANGKILLTGEYLVMVGAKALALPVRFGQSMHIEPAGYPHIHWSSRENGTTWFTCDLDTRTFSIITSTDIQIATRLCEILRAAKKITPGFPVEKGGLDIRVEANYPLRWGLGSSSTLISLIASWAGVDKFELFRMVSKGSGYDIACTDRDLLLFYQLKSGKINVGDAHPGKALLNNACFAFLGKKQETAEEVDAFLYNKNYKNSDIERISELSESICIANDPSILCSLMGEHEEILGRILKKKRIGKRFPGFPGSVKSLGAWGGDFAMFASEKGNEFIKTWLTQQGFINIFSYDDIMVPF